MEWNFTDLGHLSIVEMLIKHGANINAADINGHSPLHGAAKEGRKEVVRFLIERGADTNAKDKDEIQPLQLAALKGHDDIVEMLLQKYVETHLDDTNKTALCFTAISRGNQFPIVVCGILEEKNPIFC